MVCRAVKKVHDEIKASSLPDMPLIWSEFNAAYDNQVAVTDSIYMARGWRPPSRSVTA